MDRRFVLTSPAGAFVEPRMAGPQQPGKTAKGMGSNMPQSLLLRADQVVE